MGYFSVYRNLTLCEEPSLENLPNRVFKDHWECRWRRGALLGPPQLITPGHRTLHGAVVMKTEIAREIDRVVYGVQDSFPGISLNYWWFAPHPPQSTTFSENDVPCVTAPPRQPLFYGRLWKLITALFPFSVPWLEKLLFGRWRFSYRAIFYRIIKR